MAMTVTMSVTKEKVYCGKLSCPFHKGTARRGLGTNTYYLTKTKKTKSQLTTAPIVIMAWTPPHHALSAATNRHRY